MKYSENPDKQYHIQVGEGEVGKYVILPETRSAVPRLLLTLMMQNWWQTAANM